MLNAEHLIENAVCALEKYEIQEAYRQFMESPCNIELAESAGIRLDDVWVMAVYCTTTLRQDWKEKWEDSLKRWIPVTERLPEEDGQFVLTFRDNGCEDEMDVHYHKMDNPGVFQKWGGLAKTYNVEYWMPLPKSPREVHNAEKDSV